ncbi:hypothetical protein l11_21140 [Neisseria weaveri LMG 5135]|nr:hypothetical protein l11_21140 [Neisseria weaveri LMG 5135]
MCSSRIFCISSGVNFSSISIPFCCLLSYSLLPNQNNDCRSDTRIRQSAQTCHNAPQCRIQESDLHHSYLRPSENSASNFPTAYISFRRPRAWQTWYPVL